MSVRERIPSRPDPSSSPPFRRSHRKQAFSPAQIFRAALRSPYLILLFFAGILLWPLWNGERLYWGDITLYFAPMFRYAREALLQGRIPLWNPFVYCGQPFVGNPQCSLFYPGSALLLFFSADTFLAINSLLHTFLCGAFCFVFLRRWTLTDTAALSGALVFMGSACLLSRLQFPPMLQAAAYFPLLLAMADRCIDAPSARSLAGMTVATGLLLMAGHPQVAYLALLCGSLYSIMRLYASRSQARQRRQSPRLLRPALILITGTLLGSLMALVQLLPALQLLQESPRDHLTAAQADRFVLEPPHLMTLLWPRFTGHPVSGDYWGGGNAWEPALFLGWLPLLFAGYALLRCNREGLARFWSLAAAIGLWLAFGNNGGLYRLGYYTLPGLSNFHDPARFVFITTFGLVVLCAVGHDALLLRSPAFRRLPAWSLLGLIMAPLWWYGQDWNPTLPQAEVRAASHTVERIREAERMRRLLSTVDTDPRMQRRGTSEAPPTAPRLYLPAATITWKRYITEGYRDYGLSGASFVSALTEALLPNTPMAFGLEAASGYEPVPLYGPTLYDGLARAFWRDGEPRLGTLLGMLHAGFVALPSEQGLYDPAFSRLADADSSTALYWNRHLLPFGWLVRKTRRIEGRRRLAAALASPDFDPRAEAIVSGGANPQSLELSGESDREAAARAGARVTVAHRSHGSIMLHADAGRNAAFLVASTSAYPGWQAEVDGKQATAWRANAALLGVFLPAGEHTVRLRYAPQTYRIGFYLSLLAVGGLAALGSRRVGASLRGRLRAKAGILRDAENIPA